MEKYRKKPIVISAVQFDGIERVDDQATPMFEGRFDDLPDWLVEAMAKKEDDPGALFVFGDGLTIVTLEGPHRADPKDWIIRGVAGELYPCKPDIFAQTYDPADATMASNHGNEDALLVDLNNQVAALKAAQTGLKDELVQQRERADAAELARDEATGRAEAAEKEGRAAQGQLRQLGKPTKPRTFGAMPDNKILTGDALRKAIADAEDVEIVFSDGKREVGVPPIAVEGAAWKEHAFGLLLDRPVDIVGPDGIGSTSIAGYALLLDGKQVAWRERSMPLQIAPGQRIQIADDIL
ncbi:MAG TPA: hypothetical protein QF469_06485, partial [Sphingomonas sanguinis]|nr:hypothetical protein [Sphingomonas sanguinis]